MVIGGLTTAKRKPAIELESFIDLIVLWIAGKLGAAVLKHEKNLGMGAAIGNYFDWARRNGDGVLVILEGEQYHESYHKTDL